MLDFSIVFVLILLISLASLLGAKEKRCVTTCMLILGVMAAFRGATIGNDTHEYIRIFEQVDQSFIDSTRYEAGYLWLNVFLKYISDNYQIIFIVTSIFIYYSFGRFILKYSSYPLLSVILFFSYGFYSFSFTAIRQGIALAILLYSFDRILKGQFWRFLAIVFIASLFHSTAILFVIAYLSRIVKPSWKTFILFAGGGFVGTIIFSVILNYVFQLFPMYQTYTSKSYVGDAGLANMLYIILSSLILFFSYSLIKPRRYESQILPLNESLLVLVLFAVVLYILSLKANILDRIALYFNVFSIVLLPNALKRTSVFNRALFTLFIVVFFYIYSVVILEYRPGWNSVYPYSFCW